MRNNRLIFPKLFSASPDFASNALVDLWPVAAHLVVKIFWFTGWNNFSIVIFKWFVKCARRDLNRGASCKNEIVSSAPWFPIGRFGRARFRPVIKRAGEFDIRYYHGTVVLNGQVKREAVLSLVHTNFHCCSCRHESFTVFRVYAPAPKRGYQYCGKCCVYDSSTHRCIFSSVKYIFGYLHPSIDGHMVAAIFWKNLIY